ncbi:MAG: DUF3306 domain-containing protein [Hyphomicrobiaceae bacterium]|nr:DUF3306 domain-containing protein [Hyphomicrobiaceae bacterium]
MSERDNDFLSRWSRRKVEARDGGLKKKQTETPHKPGRMRTDPPKPKEAAATSEDGEEAPVQMAALPEGDQVPAPAEDASGSDEAQVDVPGDPADWEDFDFDSLNYGSDYTQFMKKGVPEAVRRRALRALWQSNPILANIDGLNDYDEDFTDAALVMKTFSSNYKVGSGYLTEEERLASYSEEARTVGSDAPDEEAEDTEVADVEDMDVEDMDDEDILDDDTRFSQVESDGSPEPADPNPDNDTV